MDIKRLKEDISNVLTNACKGMGDVEGLLKFMEDKGFYESPASSKYHFCCEDGLAMHSWNV